MGRVEAAQISAVWGKPVSWRIVPANRAMPFQIWSSSG
jgi:hypothetical protein